MGICTACILMPAEVTRRHRSLEAEVTNHCELPKVVSRSQIQALGKSSECSSPPSHLLSRKVRQMQRSVCRCALLGLPGRCSHLQMAPRTSCFEQLDLTAGDKGLGVGILPFDSSAFHCRTHILFRSPVAV